MASELNNNGRRNDTDENRRNYEGRRELMERRTDGDEAAQDKRDAKTRRKLTDRRTQERRVD